jgi:hypothetical protein
MGDALDERGREPRHEFCRASLSTLLLPRALADAAAAVEPARFDALVDALAAEWAASSPADAGRVDATLKWVSLVGWCARTRRRARRRASGGTKGCELLMLQWCPNCGDTRAAATSRPRGRIARPRWRSWH